MKSVLRIVISFGIFSFIATSAVGLDLIFRDEKGVTHYNCVNACGPVKVRKSGRCQYLVQSIYFSGKVRACYAEKAGLQACGEVPLDPVKPLKKGLINTACQ